MSNSSDHNHKLLKGANQSDDHLDAYADENAATSKNVEEPSKNI